MSSTTNDPHAINRPAPSGLPAPDAAAAARSARLAAAVRAEIAAGGPIPFSRFMERVLYEPGLGYYQASPDLIGEAGDFVTAPEISPLFGRCLARQCEQVLTALGSGDILEVGAGRGTLCIDVLDELGRRDALPGRYLILELGTDLRALQRARIEARLGTAAGRVHWIDALPDRGFRGVVLANELLDAMPVERFSRRDGKIHTLAVANEGDRFVWRALPAPERLLNTVETLSVREPYVSELNTSACAWIKTLAERIARGAAFLIDYGFPRHEFYHPQRSAGTLLCHYRHRVHDDPLILIGLQDITAHVDFSAIAEAGAEVGFDLLGYTSQAMFLLGNGLDELVSNSADIRERTLETSAINRLTSPAEMGELHKVIALGRGVNTKLSGFGLQDRRGRL